MSEYQPENKATIFQNIDCKLRLVLSAVLQLRYNLINRQIYSEIAENLN